METSQSIFRELNEEETLEFKKWARENFHPEIDISPIWHPVVKQELSLMGQLYEWANEISFYLEQNTSVTSTPMYTLKTSEELTIGVETKGHLFDLTLKKSEDSLKIIFKPMGIVTKVKNFDPEEVAKEVINAINKIIATKDYTQHI